MKALSVRQPFANQILTGVKTIEFRTWGTGYRGDLVICSSRKPEIMHAGCTICLVRLFAIDEHAPNDFHWYLTNVRPLVPIKVIGRQSLWEISGKFVILRI